MDKGARLANYVATLRKELLQLAHVCGVPHPALVTPDQCEVLHENFGSRTLRETFGMNDSDAWGVPSPDQQEQIKALMTVSRDAGVL